MVSFDTKDITKVVVFPANLLPNIANKLYIN